MLTGCGKAKTSRLLPIPEPSTVEAEPEPKQNPWVGVAMIAAIVPALIMMKNPNPQLAVQNLKAYLKDLVSVGGVYYVCAEAQRKKRDAKKLATTAKAEASFRQEKRQQI
jgi:predicted Zn-dependent protease